MNNIENIIIKPAGEMDRDEIMKINHYVHEWHVQNHPDFFNDAGEDDLGEYFRNSLKDERFINLFAWIDNQIVGYIQAEKRIYRGTPFTKPSRTMSINIIIVLPEYRKKGVGEKLYMDILKQAKETSFNRIEMNYWEGNEFAPAFFKKMGFKPIRHFMYQNIE